MDIGFLSIMIVTAYLLFFENTITIIAATLFLFITTAFIFASMNRTFIALSLVIIYLGAILVLVLFVIMLTHNAERVEKKLKRETHFITIVFASLCYKLTILNAYFFSREVDAASLSNLKNGIISEINNIGGNEIEKMSKLMYETEIYLFQLCIILLLISLIICISLIKNFQFEQKKLLKTPKCI